MGMNSIDAEDDQFAYRYDTQLLIDRRDKDMEEDESADYNTDHIEGNSLIAAGDEDLVKIHFHTNEPWKVLEYCSTVGEIYDIVVEDMIRDIICDFILIQILISPVDQQLRIIPICKLIIFCIN